MRRVPRLRQPGLLLPSTPTSAAPSQFAPCVRAISTSAPRCEKAPISDRIRQALWKGPAPGPEDPYAQPAEHKHSEEKRELEAYEAELDELVSQQYDLPEGENIKKGPVSKLKTARQVKGARAPKPKDAAGGYTPATSAEGLEEVGGLDGWWDRPGHWGAESIYVGFAPATGKITNPAVLEVLVRQAVVEAVAVQQNKTEQKDQAAIFTQSWDDGDRHALQRALSANVTFANDGTATIQNHNKITKNLNLVPGSQESKANDKRKAIARGEAESLDKIKLTPHEAAEIVKTSDKSWKNIPLTNDIMKFGINKRIFQLTGHLIADPKLARAETASQLLDIVVRPPPPKKVYEQLVLGGELGLPNVQIHQRRQTPIDQEKSVGRWKLIVKELEARGLPVTGHKDYEPHKETKWTKGGV